MDASLFTMILRGDIPSHKVYEDELTYAFLDIHPKTPGHTLVIPKKQVEFVWDMDDKDYDALMTAVKKVATRLHDVLGTTYVGEMIEGVMVPHAHVHVFGFSTIEEYRRNPDQEGVPDHPALVKMAKKLAF